MALQQQHPGTYFDLGEARQVTAALYEAFNDAGAPCKIGIGPLKTSAKESVVVYATDDTTSAVWCEDDTLFSGGIVSTVNRVGPELLGPTVFGKDAFLNQKGQTTSIAVDGSIYNKLKSKVVCETDSTEIMTPRIPTGESPCKVLYYSVLSSRHDIIAFLASLGMLYGFGDSPGIAVYKDKLEGMTTGTMSGTFECKLGATTIDPDTADTFYELPRAFCYVVLNMLLAAKVNEQTRDVVFAIYDGTASGLGLNVLVKCGPCCIYTQASTKPKPSWNTYMPVAFVDQVQIGQPEAVLLFSAVGSTMYTDKTGKPVVLSSKGNAGLFVTLPNGSRVYCDSDMGNLPNFDIPLSPRQVAALSFAIGAIREETDVEITLGEDDEILIGMDIADFWIIRLR